MTAYRAGAARRFEEPDRDRERARRWLKLAIAYIGVATVSGSCTCCSGVTLPHFGLPDWRFWLSIALASSWVPVVIAATWGHVRAGRAPQILVLDDEGVVVVRQGKSELFRRWGDITLAHIHRDGSIALASKRSGHQLKVVSAIAREKGFVEALLTHAAGAAPRDDQPFSRVRARGLRPESVATVRLRASSGPRLVNDTRVTLVDREGVEHVVDMYGPEAFELAVTAVKAGATVE